MDSAMNSAAYSAAFKMCCEKEFGLSDKRVRQIVEDYPKLQKRVSDLETMSRRKIAEEILHNIYDIIEKNPEDERIYLVLDALKKIGYYNTVNCVKCKRSSFCSQRVPLCVGDSELEIHGCTEGVNID